MASCPLSEEISVPFIFQEMMSETKLQGEVKQEGDSGKPVTTTQELRQRLRELEVLVALNVVVEECPEQTHGSVIESESFA